MMKQRFRNDYPGRMDLNWKTIDKRSIWCFIIISNWRLFTIYCGSSVCQTPDYAFSRFFSILILTVILEGGYFKIIFLKFKNED